MIDFRDLQEFGKIIVKQDHKQNAVNRIVQVCMGTYHNVRSQYIGLKS